MTGVSTFLHGKKVRSLLKELDAFGELFKEKYDNNS